MKYLTEYRDATIALPLIERIKRAATRPWTLMEVCGGQTHTIVRQGLDELLEGAIEMIHGPGCPVCVTPLEQIDKALMLAARPDVIFTSFGDMLRVPGSDCDLQQVRSRGGNVRVVYSPLDALEIARRHPDREVVFFAVGFETTAPANAMAVWRARELGVPNFSVLVSHVTVPPAISAIMESPDNRVQGFLAAGHVCAVMGWTEYEPLAMRYRVPIVVTGFEPLDILEGMLMAVQQLEGHWRDPDERPAAPAGVRRLRCGTEVRTGRRSRERIVRVPRRRRTHGKAQAATMPRVRHPLHSGAPPWCAHGIRRRCVRGVLPPREIPRAGRLHRGRSTIVTAVRSVTLVCPAPLDASDRVQLGHGSGGKMSAALLRERFLPALANDVLAQLGDGALVNVAGVEVVLSTDTFVVSPLEFPGGDIGSLAVHGTLNDVVMMGARPVCLSAGFVLEEGLSLDILDRIVRSMADAASRHEGRGAGQGRRSLHQHHLHRGGRRAIPPVAGARATRRRSDCERRHRPTWHGDHGCA